MSFWHKVLMSVFLSFLVFGCVVTKNDSGVKGFRSQSSAPRYNETVVGKIYFDFDKSSISKEGKSVLLDVVRLMQENPGGNLLIVGHTDYKGTDEYNIALGERRANSAKAFIANCDKSLASRITVDSKGKSQPEVIGKGEEARSKNRRDVLFFSSVDKASDRPAGIQELSISEEESGIYVGANEEGVS